tara:strand:- start:306 stop:608 length:303 start_codon:yes stop_codon:yes gene_type:complete
MNRVSLYRQLGGHHWKNGIREHLNQTYPRPRTIVSSYYTGWNYIIEDTPNSSCNLQLKTFYIDYSNNNIDFESPDFEQQLNQYIDTNPLSVLNVRTNSPI